MSPDLNSETDQEEPNSASETGRPEKPSDPAGPAAADLRAVADELAQEFPLVAERPSLVLFDVDPDHLQAQWQVNDAAVAAAWSAFPPGSSVQPMLRLQRIGGDGASQQVAALPGRTPAAGLQGTARLAIEGGQAEFEAELGLASAEGGWLLLARSNRVRPPRQVQQRPAASVIAAPAPAHGPAAPGPSQGPSPESGAPGMAHPPSERRPAVAAEQTPDRVLPGRVPLAGGEPAAPGPEPSSGLGPVEPALAGSATALEPLFPLAVSDPGPVAERLQQAITAAADRVRAEALPGAPEPPPARTRAEQTGVPAPARPPEPAVPGPWPELPPPILPSTPEGGPGSGPTGPYDPRGALSSGILQADAATGGLEIHAELLVWGRAAPGSLINVFGRLIRVDADGRFFLRRPIGDAGLLVQALSEEAAGDAPVPGAG